MATEQMDSCPRCKKPTMPTWNPEGKETARACSSCQFVEERYSSSSAATTVQRETPQRS